MFISLIFAVGMQALSAYLLITLDEKMETDWFLTLGVFVFGSFIILDLRALANRIPTDEYIMGAFTLYVDLMTFYVFVLTICGNKKR